MRIILCSFRCYPLPPLTLLSMPTTWASSSEPRDPPFDLLVLPSNYSQSPWKNCMCFQMNSFIIVSHVWKVWGHTVFLLFALPIPLLFRSYWLFLIEYILKKPCESLVYGIGIYNISKKAWHRYLIGNHIPFADPFVYCISL